MYFGVDYYPEHWSEERWHEDARLMKEANFNVVRLAEFAWAKIEPSLGIYDFGWLDEIISIFQEYGIKVVLGTPTAAAPKWLMDMEESMYQNDAYGRERGFGSRRHYCCNNPEYRKHTQRIVEKMAEHYKNNENVIAWQIDNEFGCHDTTRCYCEHCRRKFINWLKDKYGTLENLNEQWGTIFWSQIYTDWQQIILPAYTTCFSPEHSYVHNPGLMLDYYRFCSDSVIEYQNLQIDILKKMGCRHKITTNMMGHFSEIDYFKQAQQLDFACWDNYPDFQWGASKFKNTSSAHSIIRGLKNKNFWVMEQQSGPCGWNTLGNTPGPGKLRLWTYQSIANGAEGIVYFRWRACRFGIEQYWYGILDHDGMPGRRYEEIKSIGNELKKIENLLDDAQVVCDAAIIKSYDNVWSHQFQKHNKGFDYNALICAYYSALAENWTGCDIISHFEGLSRYKVVFAPALNAVNQEIAEKLANYVESGGALVLTFRSGTREWNNKMAEQTLPGMFKDMAGVEVYEFDSLNQGRKAFISGIMGEAEANIWCDILKPVNADVLAVYESNYYAKQAAATVNRFGKGRVYYIGCDMDEAGLTRLVQIISNESGIKPVLPYPVKGVEVIKRKKGEDEFYIILNHNEYDAVVDLGYEGYKDGIAGYAVSRYLKLPAYGVRVIYE